MACLVEHFEDRGLQESISTLEQVIMILRDSVIRSRKDAEELSAQIDWACTLKRRQVEIAGRDSWNLLSLEHHDYGEIVDQCATLARLFEAMCWAKSDLPDCQHVLSCDPTQSSDGAADLILDGPGAVAVIEVSDTIGTAFRAKVRAQTTRLVEARRIVAGVCQRRVVRSFIAMNVDGGAVPRNHWTNGSTAIWEIFA